jgi:hypothetical protein
MMATIKITEPIPNPYTCNGCGQENLSLDHNDASCPGYHAQLFIPMVLRPDGEIVEPEPVRELPLNAKLQTKLLRDADRSIRGKGAPPKKQIRALAEKYTAEGDTPHTVARKIRSEIGGTYTAKNVRELLRYKLTK